MSGGRIYSKYRMLVTALGLNELDVYRINREGRSVDIIRVYDPSSGRIALVDLGTTRESLSLDEFLDRLIAGLEKGGVKISERRINAVKTKLLPQLKK